MCNAPSLASAVERRLSKIGNAVRRILVSPLQLAVLALQFLEPLTITRGRAVRPTLGIGGRHIYAFVNEYSGQYLDSRPKRHPGIRFETLLRAYPALSKTVYAQYHGIAS